MPSQTARTQALQVGSKVVQLVGELVRRQASAHGAGLSQFGQVTGQRRRGRRQRIPTAVGAIDDLGVAPFVVRTGVIWGGHSGV